MRRVFDRDGRCWQRLTLCRAIDPADYDRCVAGPAGAASVQRALGDTRTGAQLLAEAAADRGVTMGRLRRSERGRGWLGALAGEVRRRFARTVRAAREVVEGCPEVEAWARRRVERPWPPDEEGEEAAAAEAEARRRYSGPGSGAARIVAGQWLGTAGDGAAGDGGSGPGAGDEGWA